MASQCRAAANSQDGGAHSSRAPAGGGRLNTPSAQRVAEPGRYPIRDLLHLFLRPIAPLPYSPPVSVCSITPL